MPSLLIAIAMGVIVYLFNFLSISVWQILVLQICAGISIYIGLANLFKIESFSYLVDTIKHLFHARKGVSE